MMTTMQGFVEDVMYVSQCGILIPTEGMLRISAARGFCSHLTA